MAHPALAGLQGVDWVDVRLLEELSFLSQDDGYATPSRHYLANIIGCTVRTITRHLTKLVRRGYLQRQLRTYRTADGKIRNRTNLYRVALDQAARIKAFLSALGRGKSGDSTGGTPVSSRPKTEKKIEPHKDTVSPLKAPQPAYRPPWQLPETYSEGWRDASAWQPAESAPLTRQERAELSTLIGTVTGKAKELAERFLRLGRP